MLSIFGVLTTVVVLGFLAWQAWALFFGSRALSGPPAAAAPAGLTVTGVAPERRPGAAEAFCAISGFLVAPGLAPTEVYKRVVVPEGGRWPQMGEELHAHYLPGKAATHWWLDPSVGWNAR